MAIVSVRIPQIGEGLQEARLVAVLKQAGERVKRDEPIYQMETDKAVMDVESPFEGVLVEWLGRPDDILVIGAEVARMEVAGGEPVDDANEPPPAKPSNRRVAAVIPPRTRAYAKEKGLTEAELTSIPSDGKMMPADIDAFLASRSGDADDKASADYVELPLSQKQRLLASRMSRGARFVVPGTISVAADWEPIERRRNAMRAAGGEFQPSAFTMFAFAVAVALRDHPALRTTLVDEETLRTYRHAALGIAVGLPGDELVLAVVENADALTWVEFAHRTRERIELARTGKDQATEAVALSLTNMQSYGIREAVAVVVPPAVATLFLGEPHVGFDREGRVRRVVNLALTFDHRLINGVGAAQFLNRVRDTMEAIDTLLS